MTLVPPILVTPIRAHQVAAARRVMSDVCNEIWKIKTTVEELESWFDQTGEFEDLNHLQTAYFDNRGLFVVATDDGRVVGTGAVKQLSQDICELKRMWILSSHRAHGLGLQIVRPLFAFALEQGYKKVRLEVYDPPRQGRALAFYTRLGFYEIAPYRDSPARLSMEKVLTAP